jgi:hypothetical protein
VHITSYGKPSFVLQAEFSDEGILESFPSSELQKSIFDLVMDDSLGEEHGPAGFHI